MDATQSDSTISSFQKPMLRFINSHPSTSSTGPRLGQLIRDGKTAIQTPHHVATTSRGVVPHVSHDTLQKHTAIGSIYLGLEDFIEKQINGAPIFKTPVTDYGSRLRTYISYQADLLTILGPRRVPALACPVHNTSSALSICTSVGFGQLGADDYHNALLTLKPDVGITMADVVMHEAASLKRIEKSADRTHAWLRDASENHLLEYIMSNSTAIFAAIPPVNVVQQSLYLQDLAEEYSAQISGLAFYSSAAVVDLPKALVHLPRICLSGPESPQAVLKELALGIDLITAPFVTSSSDHGIALEFEFDGIEAEQPGAIPLGHNLWLSGYERSLQSLSPGCNCFTCTRHHKAYLNHLLQAREMLAWTLLQIHNHAVIDRFFEAVRKSIAGGSFDKGHKAFNRKYEVALPTKTGLGPRIRGYQTKSKGGGEAKKNAKLWSRFEDATQKVAEPEPAMAILQEPIPSPERTVVGGQID